ncbi:MAG: hypothetical protein FWE37_00445 [Spirochaetaceae bacterium]|nr:hypothetical protein [Spirochaetaceae bacterium]
MKYKLLLSCLLLTTNLWAQHINLPANRAAVLPATDYVIYIPWGTLPTLYVALHAQLHNTPSFLWYFRVGTLNNEAQPSHLTLVGTPGATADVALMGREVARIIQQNPNASFTLYTDDMQAGRIFIELLIANGVKDGNYFVRILSDGTGTYNFYRNLFNRTGAGFEVFNNAMLFYFNLFYRAGVTGSAAHLPRTNNNWADLANQMFALATYPFAELWLSHPDLLLSADYRMGLARMLINAREVTPQFLFSLLNRAQTESFLQLVNFDRTYFDNLLGQNSANRPPLVVTMSDPIPANFNTILAQILRDYADYAIFLKPHPNAAPTAAQIAHYRSLGVVEILPARMPMEVFIWAYPHIKLGGFQSSLYMSAGLGQVLFFIANGPNDLPEPLISLYQRQGFPGVRFINR